jgi:hypothetical protein
MEMKKISDEIKGKKRQIASLEREIAHATLGSQGKVDKLELSPVMFLYLFWFGAFWFHAISSLSICV